MKLKNNELAAVVYADLFGYPLTVSEAKLWSIRKARKENSDRKLELAKTVSLWLAKIPTIEAVFLTGSVAVGNAKKSADIDLLIITKPGTMWLTRLVVVLILKSQGIYRKIICPNIFLDTNHLEIKEKNIYTAHEVLQAKCLFDRSNINYLWLKENKWTANYLPNAYHLKWAMGNNSMSNQWAIKKLANYKINHLLHIAHCSLLIICICPLEVLAFIFQYLYMKRKITHESVGWGFAFFHPNRMGEKIVEKFESRVSKLCDF